MAFRGPRDQGITSSGSSRRSEGGGVGPSPAAISRGSQAEMVRRREGNLRLSQLYLNVSRQSQKSRRRGDNEKITRDTDDDKGKNQQRQVVLSRLGSSGIQNPTERGNSEA